MRLPFQNLALGSCFESKECVNELAELFFGLGDGDVDISGSRKVVVTKDIGFFVIERGRWTRVLRDVQMQGKIRFVCSWDHRKIARPGGYGRLQ